MIAAGQVLGHRVSGLPVDPLPDNAMDTYGVLPIARMVEDKLRAVHPEVVYTHWPYDLNQDHRMVAQAALVATRPQPEQGVKAVYAFEVPSSTEWGFVGACQHFSPNVFVDIWGYWGRKWEAVERYGSEHRDYPHPRSGAALHARARYWGSVAGVELAEAFVLLREIR